MNPNPPYPRGSDSEDTDVDTDEDQEPEEEDEKEESEPSNDDNAEMNNDAQREISARLHFHPKFDWSCKVCGVWKCTTDHKRNDDANAEITAMSNDPVSEM